jgi:hypothetical protein
MRRKKKLFLSLFGFLFLVSASLVSAALFYYYRPAKTKTLIEESISRITGTVCTIEELSYSVRPPTVRAKGVLLVGHMQGLLLEIPELSAGISFRGPFGHKTLTITHLKVNGFSLSTHQEMTLEKIQAPQESLPFFGHVLKTLVASLLFREISIEAMQMSEGHVVAEFGDTKVTLNSVRGGTTQDHLLEIACEAKVEWPSQDSELLAQEISLTSDRVLTLEGPEMMGDLKASKVRFEHPDISLADVTIESKLIYDREKTILTLQALGIKFNELLFLKHQGPGQAPLTGSLLAKASLDLARHQVTDSDFRLLLKDMLELRGSLDLDGMERMRLQFRGLDGYIIPEKVEPFLPDFVKKPLAPFKVKGPVGIHGDVVVSKKEKGEALDFDLEVRLTGNEISYTSLPFFSQGIVTGRLHASGEFPNLRSNIKISCNPIDFRSEWFHAKGGRLDLSMEGENPVFQIQNVALSLPEARIGTGRTEVLLNAVRSEIHAGTINLEKGVFTVQDGEIQTSLLRNLRLSVKRDEGETELDVRGEDTHLLESAHALKWIGPEWQFSGRDSFQARLTLQDNGGWKAFSQILLDGSRFENAGLDWAGENISMVLSLASDGHLDNPTASWKTSLEMSKGEILLERFYLDMGKNGFTLSGDGVYDYARKSFRLSGLQTGLKDLVTLNAQGTLSASSDSLATVLEVNIPKTEVEPLFRQFVLEPFRQEKAFLANLDVKGSISAELELRSRRGNLVVKGRCRWDEGSVDSVARALSVQGIQLDLPFWLHGMGTGEKAGPALKSKHRPARQRASVREETLRGSLRIESAAFPMLPTQSFTFHLEARPNQLSSPSSTRMKIPGGEIEWGPFLLSDPLSPAFSLVTSLHVNDVQLDQILAKAWERPLRGSARGRLDPIEISGDEINSKGKIEADVFGGTMSIMNPGAYGIFSIAPVLYLDAQWEGLLLGELTEGTPFGKVEGVLKGHARGIEVSGREPQKFDLFLETVPQEGVPQTISTKAVDNISQIGGGQSALTGVFASFFKEFPYEKIGIHASLENDLFRINGTIKEGGAEHFVKRGGFSGVNVINQNPDNLISFKDMVKRVKRVATSGREAVVQ